MKKRTITLKLGEFFCGPGGFALGASVAAVRALHGEFRIRHAWATDYDRDSCDTYTRNICPDTPESVICEDVRTLDFGKLRQLSDIDIFCFGFPCNDYSVVGERKGIHGEFGPLYAYGVEAIRYFRPKFFVAENVGGLKGANNGNTFGDIVYTEEKSMKKPFKMKIVRDGEMLFIQDRWICECGDLPWLERVHHSIDEPICPRCEMHKDDCQDAQLDEVFKAVLSDGVTYLITEWSPEAETHLAQEALSESEWQKIKKANEHAFLSERAAAINRFDYSYDYEYDPDISPEELGNVHYSQI